jgi:CHAD domain-containing protein
MTLREYARDTLERYARRVDEQIALVLAGPGVDPVHDFRVSVRRYSQALRTFASLMSGREARRMRRDLRQALDAAATVRDLDVGQENLDSLDLPPDHPFRVRMAAERDLDAQALLGRLYLLRAKQIPLAHVPRFDALLPVVRAAAEEARMLLPPASDDFFRIGRKTAAAVSPERLHAFRLSAKRFRYTLELFRPFYGPVLRRRLEAVRQIQNLLGHRQDCAVLSARIRPLAGFDPALDTVLAAIDSRAARLENEFLSYWRGEFDADGQQLLWHRYLARRQPTSRLPAPRVAAAPRSSIK